MIREALGKLTEEQKTALDALAWRHKAGWDGYSKAVIGAYLKGLRDAGAITERDRQILYIRMTA